jgi:hypothetical protein
MDFKELDDPAFLDLRRRVRTELETTQSADLTARMAALDDEFDRRASAAWEQAAAS